MTKYNQVKHKQELWACGILEYSVLPPTYGVVLNGYFVKYKEHEEEKICKFLGKIDYEKLEYADTYDECVEIFNRLIDEEITMLESRIGYYEGYRIGE